MSTHHADNTAHVRPSRKLPVGKEQFGIIVPSDIHREAKHLAADLGVRISDIYASGVRKLAEDRQQSGEMAARAMLGREITEGVAIESWVFFRALKCFLLCNPQEQQLQMLCLLLRMPLFEASRSEQKSAKDSPGQVHACHSDA